jgi:tetratricopeptide (TPR) repeat protein
LISENPSEAASGGEDRSDPSGAERFTLATSSSDFAALHGLGVLQLERGRHSEALHSFRAALALRPGDAAALSNFGLVLAQSGRPRAALTSYDRALAAQPDFAEALANRGDVLRALRRPKDALASYDRAIALRPDVAETFNNRGIALLGLNRLAGALESCDRALALQPDCVEALNNRGHILLALGRAAAALVSFDRALSLDPGLVAGHINQGRALVELDRAEDAIASYNKALAFAPDHAEVYDAKGRLLREIGRLDEAVESIEASIQLAPNKAFYYLNLTMTRRMKRGERYLSDMEELANRSFAPGSHALMFLHFALGRACADIEDFERSFHHFARGNALKRKRTVYDEKATLDALKSLGRAFTIRVMRRLKGCGDPSQTPVFVVGMPRSGTTLVEQVLAAHSKVGSVGESLAFHEAAREVGGAVAQALRSSEVAPQIAREELRRLGAAYCQRIGVAASEAQKIVNKMPANFRFLGLIHLALPNARIIHMKRDPIDTCLSHYTLLFGGNLPYAYDLSELGRYYRAYQSVMAHWRTVLPPSVMLEVQYEDLVANFTDMTKRIVLHCGLDWDARCLEPQKNNGRVRTASAAQVRQPIYATSVGRWRPYEPFLQPLLTELGRPGGDSDEIGASREYGRGRKAPSQSPYDALRPLWRWAPFMRGTKTIGGEDRKS